MANKLLPPGQSYAGRPTQSKVLNITIDRDAEALLLKYAGDGMRPKGRFLERLIFEHHARMEERAKIQAEQATT